MGEKSQILRAEEFPREDVDTLPRRRENRTSQSFRHVLHVWNSMERRKQGNGTVGTPDKRYHSQVIELKVNSRRSC